MWYVHEFLVPQLLSQGADPADIRIRCDTHGEGNLESTIRCFEQLEKTPGGTWHIQDDVLPARDFVRRCEQYAGDEIACGFCVDSFDTSPGKTGHVPQCFLWLSFPCIYIPNAVGAEFARWYRTVGYDDPEVGRLRRLKKGDDTLFWLWHHNARPQAWGWNLAPNLVEHVDILLGGSLVNSTRDTWARAKYWDDEEAVQALADRIQNRMKARA